MEYVPVSYHHYVDLHVKNNPEEKRRDVEEKLNKALSDFRRGGKCDCGDNLWVIGSAFMGNRFFSCLTGDHSPSGHFEVDEILNGSPFQTRTLRFVQV